jgi:hypothetical protein
MLLGLSLAATILASAANAQSVASATASTKTDAVDPSDEGWHVDVAPYLWFPGVHGTVGAARHEPSTHKPFHH